MAVINILEDDEVIRGQLSQLLRDKGYEVIESRCVFTRRRWI